jgi:glutathione S-transferase
MIIVHHLEFSRSHRILWLLEELKVPYEIKLYKRDPKSRLAPPELKQIHPLGKSPVIEDNGEIIAESGAIIEYLVETYSRDAEGDLARLQPRAGSKAHRQCRFWMHYAEGSLMNWLVMKLVFTTIPTQPMPFFVRPVARELCKAVLAKLVDPNVNNALNFMEAHLTDNAWFAGEDMTMADFQMSFAVVAALSRSTEPSKYPQLHAFKERIEARPAYKRAVKKGGPLLADFQAARS